MPFWKKKEPEIGDDHRGHVGQHNLHDFLTDNSPQHDTGTDYGYSSSDTASDTASDAASDFSFSSPSILESPLQPPPAAAAPQAHSRSRPERAERSLSPSKSHDGGGGGGGLQRSSTFPSNARSRGGGLQRSNTTFLPNTARNDEPTSRPPKFGRTTTMPADYRTRFGRSNTFKASQGPPPLPLPLPPNTAWMQPPPPPPGPRKKKRSSSSSSSAKKPRRPDDDLCSEQMKVPVMLCLPDNMMRQESARPDVMGAYVSTEMDIDMGVGAGVGAEVAVWPKGASKADGQMEPQPAVIPVGDGNFI